MIISFSLNADLVARRWERGAPLVANRIEAAKKVFEAGYENRIRIDPMVPILDWQTHYTDLIDQIFKKLTPERITLGSLRGLAKTIKFCKDPSWVKYLTEEETGWGKKIGFNLRQSMYLLIIQYLKEKFGYANVSLCKETKDMWEKLGLDWTNCRCNCVW